MEPQQNHDVTLGVVIYSDGYNSGTAPLQSTDIPIDTFEGVRNMNDSTTAQIFFSGS